jgi:hypothetical protein
VEKHDVNVAGSASTGDSGIEIHQSGDALHSSASAPSKETGMSNGTKTAIIVGGVAATGFIAHTLLKRKKTGGHDHSKKKRRAKRARRAKLASSFPGNTPAPVLMQGAAVANGL